MDNYTTTENYITKELHAEFAKRVEEENCRQNHRIAQLETGLMKLTSITTSVERLAINMENMATEQGRQNTMLAEQGNRLTELESADGKKWRSLVEKILTAVIGLAIGFLGAKFGLK